MILAYYIQTLNPFIWQWGNSGFGIRWYGTAYLLGFIIAYLLMKRFIRTGRMLLPMEQLPDFVLFVAIFGVLIGGRLGEAILYRPGMFTNFSPHCLFGQFFPTGCRCQSDNFKRLSLFY